MRQKRLAPGACPGREDAKTHETFHPASALVAVGLLALALLAPQPGAAAPPPSMLTAKSLCSMFNQITVPSYSIDQAQTARFEEDTTINAEEVNIGGDLTTLGALQTSGANTPSGNGIDLCIIAESIRVTPGGRIWTGDGLPAMPTLPPCVSSVADADSGGRGGNLLLILEDSTTTTTPAMLTIEPGGLIVTGSGGAGGSAEASDARCRTPTMPTIGLEVPDVPEPTVCGLGGPTLVAIAGDGGDAGSLAVYGNPIMTLADQSIILGNGGHGGTASSSTSTLAGVTATGGEGGDSRAYHNGMPWTNFASISAINGRGGDGGSGNAGQKQCDTGVTDTTCSQADDPTSTAQSSAYGGGGVTRADTLSAAESGSPNTSCEDGDPLTGEAGEEGVDVGDPPATAQGDSGDNGKDGRGDRWAGFGVTAGEDGGGGGITCAGVTNGDNGGNGGSGGNAGAVNAVGKNGGDGPNQGGKGGDGTGTGVSGTGGGHGGKGGNGDGGSAFPCNADATPGHGGNGGLGGSSSPGIVHGGKGGGSRYVPGNGGNVKGTSAIPGLGGVGGDGGKGNDYPDGNYGCGGSHGTYNKLSLSRGARGDFLHPPPPWPNPATDGEETKTEPLFTGSKSANGRVGSNPGCAI